MTCDTACMARICDAMRAGTASAHHADLVMQTYTNLTGALADSVDAIARLEAERDALKRLLYSPSVGPCVGPVSVSPATRLERVS